MSRRSARLGLVLGAFLIVLTKGNAQVREVWSAVWDCGTASTDDVAAHVFVGDSGQIVTLAFALTRDTIETIAVGYDGNGVQRWRRKVRGALPIRASADAEGSIYLVGFDARIVKIDPRGEESWRTPVPTHSSVEWLAVGPGGTAVVASREGLHAYDADGNPAWSTQTRAGSIAVDRDGNVLAFEDNESGRLFITKYSPDGAELWSAEQRGLLLAVDANGDVYSVIGNLHAGELGVAKRRSDGQELWSSFVEPFDEDEPEFRGFLVDSTGRSFVSFRTLVPGGRYACVITAFSPDGAREWSVERAPCSAPLLQAADGQGGLYVTEVTPTCDRSECLLTHYDARGRTPWEIDLAATDVDNRVAIASNSQGNLLVAGTTLSTAVRGRDVVTTRYTEEGDIAWRATVDGTANRPERAAAVTLDSGDGVVVAGTSCDLAECEWVVLSYARDGDRRFEARFIPTAAAPESLVLDPSENIYVGAADTLVSLTPDGGERWVAPRPASFLAFDAAGDLLVAGPTCVTESSCALALAKLSTSGNVLWSIETALPEGTFADGGLHVSAEGEPTVLARTDAENNESAAVLLRFDATGNELWRLQEVATHSSDAFRGFALDSLGFVVTVGSGSRNEGIVRRYSPDGTLLWERIIPFEGGNHRLVTTSPGGLVHVALDPLRPDAVPGVAHLEPNGDLVSMSELRGWRDVSKLIAADDGSLYLLGTTGTPSHCTRASKLDAQGRELGSFCTDGLFATRPSFLARGTNGALAIAGSERSDLKTILYVEDATAFIRGDTDADGSLALPDAVVTLEALFLAAPPPSCLETSDVDDSGAIDLTDAVYLLNGLFLDGPPPRSPFPDCDSDPTVDTIGCEEYPACP